MRVLTLLIIAGFLVIGCGRKGKTTCSPTVFTTSSSTVKCDKIKFSVENLPEDQLMFMVSGYSIIAEEVSKGQGEYLNALSALLNCEDATLLTQTLQSRYSAIFTGEKDPVQSLGKIHTLVKDTPLLQQSCTLNGSSVLLTNPGFLEM